MRWRWGALPITPRSPPLVGQTLRLPSFKRRFPIRHNSSQQGGKEFKERIRFYDRAFLTLKAGTGGNGNKSFITDRYGNKLPDGERGGDGGDVILQACSHQQALKFESFHHMGKKGENGKSNNKRGRKGADYVIKVPIGTVVKRVHRDEETRERSFSDVIADLTEESQRFCAAKGGKGGQGNVSFKTKWQRRPEIRELGKDGESTELFLELKAIADVGLVGFPNAGKSSFLRRVSRARPKVGHWPFTTLQPHVGIVEAADPAMTQFTVADIPGLIEGASEGRGLGHHFLRHIERVKVLLFVLDGASSDFRCPAEDLHQLITELNTYSPKIAQRPALVFLNKNDIDEGVFEHNEQKVRATSPFEVVVGTAAEENAIGMQDVIDKLHDLLRKADPENFPTYTRRHS